jgi:hypothetical protein
MAMKVSTLISLAFLISLCACSSTPTKTVLEERAGYDIKGPPLSSLGNAGGVKYVRGVALSARHAIQSLFLGFVALDCRRRRKLGDGESRCPEGGQKGEADDGSSEGSSTQEAKAPSETRSTNGCIRSAKP